VFPLDGDMPVTVGMACLDGRGGRCGDGVLFLSSREDTLSGCRMGGCMVCVVGCIEDVRGG